MKKLFIIPAILILALSLASCGTGSADQTTSSEAGTTAAITTAADNTPTASTSTAASTTEKTTKKNTTNANRTTKKVTTTKKKSSGENKSNTITKAKFDKIKNGMSYDEVVKIIGSKGTQLSESEVGNYKTVMYMWYGSDGISNANITFMNDKVQAKAQLGLN